MLRLNNISRTIVNIANSSRNSCRTRFISSLQLKLSNQPQQRSYHCLLEATKPAASVSSLRFYSSKKEEEEVEAIENDPEVNSSGTDFLHTHLPATVAIPEVWPYLPVIAVSRSPVFPRFMKILEVSEEN